MTARPRIAHFAGPNATIQNSQCAVNAAASSSVTSGNTLTVNLALNFMPVFAGAKNIYMEVSNATAAVNNSTRPSR